MNAVQDPSDPRQRMCMRSSTKGWRSDRRNTPLISFALPEDFGSAAYYERRRREIEKEIKHIRKANNILEYFSNLLQTSELLRDYLWVNDDTAINTAQQALSILPRETVIACLHWAIQDFWERRSGWPYLLIHNDVEYRFVEVKSPHDRLSQEQMNWFDWAISDAHIPCELYRIKKAKQKRNT